MRWLVLLLALGAGPSLARGGNSRAQAQEVLDKFLSGTLGLNQLVNRLDYLGEQAWASEALTDAYKHLADPRKRGQVVEAMAALCPRGYEDGEKVMLSALPGAEVSLKLQVLRGLGRVRSTRAVASLVPLLKDASPTVRKEAAKALGAIGQRPTGPALAAALKDEADVEARVGMLTALGQLGDLRQATTLEPFLKDSSETTRLAATQALCMLGAKSGLDAAKALLASKDGPTRLSGVQTLDGVKAAVAAPLLKGALTDPDHRVRALAGAVLVRGGDATKVDFLVVESAKAEGDDKLRYEEQLERLHLTDEQRAAILKKAGLK